MSKRAGNLERPTALDRQIGIDNFLIAEGELCPYCKDLDCSGRGVKQECMLWPAYAAKHGIGAEALHVEQGARDTAPIGAN